MIKHWKKVGKPETLAKGYGGRKFLKQRFRDPVTRKVSNFYFVDLRNGAVVLPITEDGRVITVKQFSHGLGRVTTELPAGGIEKGETRKLAIKRELLEEAGYKPGRIVYLGKGWLHNRSSFNYYHIFLALGCRKTNKPEEKDHERTGVCLISLRKFIKLLTAGKFEQAHAYMAFLMALKYLAIEIKSPKRA